RLLLFHAEAPRYDPDDKDVRIIGAAMRCERERDPAPVRRIVRKHLLFFVTIVCAGGAAPVLAQCAPDAPYQQPDAMKRRYPDPPAQFDTPAFAAGKQDFTSH